ncbi:TonB-dependent siderophore receptor [Comamonas sp. JC664]|uniref:TonB-dependent siderophore receptor n=1 Tax=Comamonas sp. JC664 TaxID=2801917 RepID=UPI00361BAFDF
MGVYGVARWSLTDALKLITGTRISNYERKNSLTGVVAPKEKGVVTPYAGLVYDINAQYSAYASYSDIFNPQTNRSQDGNVLDPVVGANYEVGIKGELLNKRLNVSAAVFRLAQSNLAVLDSSVPNNPSNVCGGACYTAAGKVVSQGFDLGVNGQVSRELNLAAGYTYTSAEYVAGPQKDQRFRTEQPRHSMRLAANYQLPGTQWSLGGNVAATNKAYKNGGSGANAWTIEQGALVLVGLNAKYRITPKTQLNMVVSNLTDRSYRHLYGREYAPLASRASSVLTCAMISKPPMRLSTLYPSACAALLAGLLATAPQAGAQTAPQGAADDAPATATPSTAATPASPYVMPATQVWDMASDGGEIYRIFVSAPDKGEPPRADTRCSMCSMAMPTLAPSRRRAGCRTTCPWARRSLWASATRVTSLGCAPHGRLHGPAARAAVARGAGLCQVQERCARAVSGFSDRQAARRDRPALPRQPGAPVAVWPFLWRAVCALRAVRAPPGL